MINNKAVSSILTVGAIAMGTIVSMGQPSVAQRSDKYFCDNSTYSVPTTVARKATGKQIALISWERDWGGEYTPEKRCEIVSSNFQKAYEKGALNYLTVGQVNNENVVCAMARPDFGCTNYLFTVSRSEDAEQIVSELILIGRGNAGTRPLRQTNNWRLYELKGVFLED